LQNQSLLWLKSLDYGQNDGVMTLRRNAQHHITEARLDQTAYRNTSVYPALYAQRI
jgi:hypothetical protein